ncbi:MAG: type II toxin-antitoxin system VapC family toxin [Bacteroidota bacterium]
MKAYLLDTNICIYILNQRPQSVFGRFKEVDINEVYFSSLVLAELHFGVQKSRRIEHNLSTLKAFVSPFEFLQFDEPSARCFGEIEHELQKSGELIGPMDLLIASQAKAHGLTLVTNNEKEFERIEGLNIENWVL